MNNNIFKAFCLSTAMLTSVFGSEVKDLLTPEQISRNMRKHLETGEGFSADQVGKNITWAEAFTRLAIELCLQSLSASQEEQTAALNNGNNIFAGMIASSAPKIPTNTQPEIVKVEENGFKKKQPIHTDTQIHENTEKEIVESKKQQINLIFPEVPSHIGGMPLQIEDDRPFVAGLAKANIAPPMKFCSKSGILGAFWYIQQVIKENNCSKESYLWLNNALKYIREVFPLNKEHHLVDRNIPWLKDGIDETDDIIKTKCKEFFKDLLPEEEESKPKQVEYTDKEKFAIEMSKRTDEWELPTLFNNTVIFQSMTVYGLTEACIIEIIHNINSNKTFDVILKPKDKRYFLEKKIQRGRYINSIAKTIKSLNNTNHEFLEECKTQCTNKELLYCLDE